MKDNKYLILVNKDNPMKNEEDYEKVLCKSIYADDRTLEKKTYEQFLKLQDFVKTQGYIIAIESGYRSSSYQKKVWDECVLLHGLEHTKTFVAVPGYSEHQTGLAVDIHNGKKVYTDFENTEEFNWMQENAYKYGFILRFPKDKVNETGYIYESWHYRYVGKDIAKYIHKNNISFEEYYARFIENKK